MAITKWDDLQLEFDLDLDEAEDETIEQAITPEEARLISEAARLAFEATNTMRSDPNSETTCIESRTGIFQAPRPEWSKEYLELREQGWPWRVACYLAWASSPKSRRRPETLEKLATEVLGLRSARVIFSWLKKYASIDTVVMMMQAKPLWEYRADVLEALATMAMQQDYKAHNDRKLFLEMIGDYIPRSQLGIGKPSEDGVVQAMSDDELRRWIGELSLPESEEDSEQGFDRTEDAEWDEWLGRTEELDAE